MERLPEPALTANQQLSSSSSPTLRAPVTTLSVLREYLVGTAQHPTLSLIATKKLSQAAWDTISIWRYHAAQPFTRLLEAGIEKAAKLPNGKRLSIVLQENLNDENGISNTNLGSHESWRRDFYGAVGVTDEQLRTSPSPVTKCYMASIERLIERQSVFEICGGLALLERTIPAEFSKLLAGCEKSFPSVMGSAHQHTPTQARARRYLEDHISHDAAVHAQQLEAALDSFLIDPIALKEVCFGAGLLFAARIAVWDDLRRYI